MLTYARRKVDNTFVSNIYAAKNVYRNLLEMIKKKKNAKS